MRRTGRAIRYGYTDRFRPVALPDGVRVDSPDGSVAEMRGRAPFTRRAVAELCAGCFAPLSLHSVCFGERTSPVPGAVRVAAATWL